MRTTLVTIGGVIFNMAMGLAMASQITTNPNEPPEYPDGVYCTPAGDLFRGLQTPDHPCKCHMVMRSATPDNCCDILQANDPVCRQYCSEKHCACQHECLPYVPQPD